MAELIDNALPEGDVIGLAYIVRYGEELWRSFNEEAQAFCKAHWLKVAKPIPNVRSVALQLIPDPLFPMFGRETPYIEWQQPIDQPADEPFHIATRIDIKLRSSSRFVDPALRPSLTAELAKYPKGTMYVISNKVGIPIEQSHT